MFYILQSNLHNLSHRLFHNQHQRNFADSLNLFFQILYDFYPITFLQKVGFDLDLTV